MRRRVVLAGASAVVLAAVAAAGWGQLAPGRHPASGSAAGSTGQQAPPTGLVALIDRAAPADDPYAFVFCSGALIAPDRVLTASHCLTDRDQADVLIDPDTVCHPGPIGGERLRVLDWRPRWHGSDLAIVRLANRASASPVPAGPGIAGRAGTFTAWGWGASPTGTAPCEVTPKLVKATSPEACAAAGVALAADAWCGVPAAGLNTCRGDSGGPLIDETGEVVAVVSGGLECGPRSPGSYVAVRPPPP